MRKLMIAAGAAAFLASASFAMAADATGAISSIDTSAGTVTLEDGKVYKLPASVDAASLKVGDKVNITFEDMNGTLTASAVTPAS